MEALLEELLHHPHQSAGTENLAAEQESVGHIDFSGLGEELGTNVVWGELDLLFDT